MNEAFLLSSNRSLLAVLEARVRGFKTPLASLLLLGQTDLDMFFFKCPSLVRYLSGSGSTIKGALFVLDGYVGCVLNSFSSVCLLDRGKKNI